MSASHSFPPVRLRYTRSFPSMRKMLRVALDRNDVDRFRFVRMHVDHEPEVGGQVAADLVPRVAGVVAAHDVPVLLHEKHVRTRRMHRDPVDAVADLRGRVGDVLRFQPLVDRPPRLAGVVGAERARGRDGDEDPPGIARDPAGSCAGTSRRHPAASAVLIRARAVRGARARSARRRSSETARRLQPRHRRCRDRSAKVRDARLA